MKGIVKHFHALITACLVGYLVIPPFYVYAAQTASSALIGLGVMPEVADYLTSNLVNVNSDGHLVLPVASGKKLIVSNGDISSSVSGGTVALQEATSAAACMGTATTNGTTAVTVSTTCATTGSRIFLSRTADATGTSTNDQSGCWATNISNGVSFDIDCSDAGDNGAVNWIIFHEAA